MAKKFLTNINLAGNQLLNAAIQPSASAPSALSAGQLYYNTNDGIFYFSTGTGTGNWEPVGVQYVKSVSGNLSVDGNGILSLDEAGLANDLASGSNFITNSGVQLNINLSSLESQLVADGFYTSSDLPANYITSVSGDFTVSGGELQINPTTFVSDLASGSTYIEASGSTIDVNLSALETQLTNDGYAHTSDIPSLSGYVTETGTETLSNKTIQGPLYFNDNITVSNEGEIVIDSGTNNFQVIAITNDLDLVSNSGNIILNADAAVYVTSATAGNEVATQGFVTGQGYITSSGQYIQSVSGDFTVSNGELQINPSTFVSDLASGSTYIEASENTIDIKLSSLETQLTNDGFVQSVDNAITLGGSGDFTIDASANIVLNPSSGDNVYVGSASNPNNVVITVGSLNALLPAYQTTSGLDSAVSNLGYAKTSDIQAAQAGLSVKDSVKVATNAAISLTSTFTSIDGVTLANLDRVLVKNQGTALENGIYTYSISTGLLVRAEDQESPKEGDFVFVEEGDYSNTGWIVQSDLTWAQFSAAGEYTFNGGLKKVGTTVSVDYTSLESQLVSDDFAKNADYSTVTRKYASSITGNSTDSTFSFTHGLNSRDVVVRVYQTSSGADQYNDVEVDVTRTSANAVSVSFASAPATGEAYAVVIVG